MVLCLSEELRRSGHTVLPVGPPRGVGWLGDHFRRVGFTPEVFRLRRPIDPGCVRGLMNLFREHRIGAVHSHEFTMAVYGAAASRLLNLPHVITMHGGLASIIFTCPSRLSRFISISQMTEYARPAGIRRTPRPFRNQLRARSR